MKLILSFLIVALLLCISFSFICFLFVFYVPPKNRKNCDDIILPEGEIYKVFWDDMRNWVLQARNTPHTDYYVTSFDGLQLHGKFYEFAPDAPIELMFHGYRGNAERDLSGGMKRCFQLGHSAFIVDQRGAGESEGNVISFGINESKDCLTWISFLNQHFGADIKIILTGISMGASTVLIASGCDLPENVAGVLADCGFTSAKEIINVVAFQMKLPVNLLYPFVKLGAKLFGHFNLEDADVISSVGRIKIPVIFFHGIDDSYVPAEMSMKNYKACGSRKKLVLVPGAGHGLCYPVDKDKYIAELADFFDYL